jgi:hypothetical protein
MKPLHISTFLLSICLIQTAGAIEQRFECPVSVAAKSIHLREVPTAWTATVPSDLRLSGAGFMGSEPANLAFLKPHSTKSTKSGGMSVWKFEGDAPQGRWLTCSYSNAISLSQRIPNTITQCSVTHAKDSAGNVTKRDIVCR